MDDFDAKFKEMQKYLPFLRNVIEKLRSSSEQSDDNPRRAQLKKMEVLHDLLKSNGKKLKIETLLKCEGLLIKLHSKMVRIPFLQSEGEASRSTNQNSSSKMSNTEMPSTSSKASSVEIVDITGPESPPPQQLEEEPPVEIPTERRGSPADDERSSKSTDSRDRHKHCSKHHKHRHHHRSHGYGHSPGRHHQHERDQQSTNETRPTSDGSKKRTGDVFSRLGERTTEPEPKPRDENHGDSQLNSNPQASSTPSQDIYSPEECWDEVKNLNKSLKSTAISTILTTSPLDVDDDGDNSPTQKQAYHDTIFNFKKQLPKSNDMFSRVRNPETKEAPSAAPITGRSAPISIPIKVPTIPEVLKSPPLTASDITELLNESDDKPYFKTGMQSIAEIGTRRPGKSTTTTIHATTSDVAESNFDKVRKKLAIVTQSSPQNRNSPDLLKSPIPLLVNPPPPTNDTTERIALKYHPHPRTERNAQRNSSGGEAQPYQTTDPRMNPNRLSGNTPIKTFVAASPTYNSALPQDPRLRKAAESSANSSLYQQPHATSHSPAVPNFNANRIEVITTTTQPQPPPKRASHIPSIVDGEVIPPSHAIGPSSLLPINTSPSVDTTYDIGGRNSPQIEQAIRAQRFKSNRSGHSSDDNWDSDPETSAVSPKPVPQMQKEVPHACPHDVPQGVPKASPRADARFVPQTSPRHFDARAVPRSVDPRYSSNHIPINESPVRMHPNEDVDIGGRTSPQVEQAVRAERNKSNKSGDSSEENWDSDPETSPVMPKSVQNAVPQVSPRVLPQVSPRADPRVVPQVSPRIDPRVVPQVSPRIDPRVVPQTSPRVPHLDSRIVPPVDPRFLQKSGPQIVSPVNPQVSSRGMPQAFPQAIPTVETRCVPPVDPRVMQQSVPQIVPPVNPQVSQRVMSQAVPRAVPHSVPQGIPRIGPQNRPYVQPQDALVDGVFRSVNHLLAPPSYSRINAVNSVPPNMSNPHMHQHPTEWLPNPNLSNFSALLNDNTERSKYFESKKQKQYQPRTYMEYKQAKARAAAEEAARRAAENAAKLAAEVSKDIGEVSEVDSSVMAKLAEQPPAASTLDKLYRSTNFSSCEFPKAKTSFKIPKKIVEKVTDKNEAETKPTAKTEIVKEDKSVTEVAKQDQTEKEETVVEKSEIVMENSAESTQISAPTEKKKSHTKEDKVKKKDKCEKEAKKKHSKENNAKNEGTEKSKKSSEKVKRKSVNKTEDISSEGATEVNVQPEIKEIEVKPETIAEIPTKPEPIYGASIDLTTKIRLNDPRLAAAKRAEAMTDVAKTEKAAEEKVDVAKTEKTAEEMEDVAKTEKTAEDPVVSAKDIIESTAAAQSVLPSSGMTKEKNSEAKDGANAAQDETSAVKNVTSEASRMPELIPFESPQKPARILRRRNTMIVRGSLPEFDKETIFPVKSLVYEDIQGVNEEERRKELDAKLPKKNRSLAEIFQKTDDNCKVSTQNIISGKRRTRTNVTFNEVKIRQEIYGKRRSEPAKPTVEIASPLVVKKNSPPKGKKGAKGKLKSDVDEEKMHVDEDKPESEQASENSECDEDNATQAVKEVDNTDKSIAGEAAEKSAKSGSRIDALMDEDAQKRHLLESFVQDILNPKKDKAQIFGLLSQILSEENLKFVKEIVESTAEKNAAQTEAEANDEVCDEVSNDDFNKFGKEDEEDETKNASNSKTAPKTKKKPPVATTKGKRKKNELDRLNEDIRTMFISSGVLTATGRRMCTLVAEQATSSNNDVQQPKPIEKDEKAAPAVKEVKTAKSKFKVVPKVLPRLRRAKVILEPINVKEIQKRVRLQRMAKEAKKRTKGTKSGSEADIDKTGETPPRKMPVLKAHTPIKQSEVEDGDSTGDETEEVPAPKKIKMEVVKGGKKVVKPGPKSKKPKSALLSDNDDEDEKESVASEAVSEKTPKTKKKAKILKNTNKEWHTQSKWIKWCMLCDKKVSYAAVHFKQMHNDNYISRLPQDVLDQLKQEGSTISKPYFSVSQKKMVYWSYHCPFCRQHNRTIQPSWVDHFITHTGEYPYECSKCHHPASKLNALNSHIKTYCSGATAVRNPTIPTSEVISAHVCNLCNYLQLHRLNLDNHLVQQHGVAKAKVAKFGYTINLFDTRDVEVVDSLKAVELEAQILNAGLHAADDTKKEEEGKSEANNESDDDENPALEVSAKAEECNSTSALETNAADADEKTSSDDETDDDVPIIKTLQRSKKAADSQAAVENVINSNVFVPTRETNDSPTMNNLAQKLFKMANETPTAGSTASSGATAAAVNTGRGDSSGSAELSSGGGISMAERLSQRFKNIKSGNTAITSVTDTPGTSCTASKTITPGAATTTGKHTESSITKAAGCASTAQEKQSNGYSAAQQIIPKQSAPEREKFNSSPNKITTANASATKEKANTVPSAPVISIPLEDDDENWEDIEITESAPSKTTSSSSNKQNKSRNKNSFHKLNRLYVTNNKLKKSLSITIGNRKKPSNEERKELEALRRASNETNTSSIAEKASSIASTTTTISNIEHSEALVSGAATETSSAQAPPAHFESNLGFRPLITNLADLLPDSPCNDPIELVPELAPIESLHDLCDVSSILNSEYISTDWQQNILPLNMNNDSSQQVSMQEALDFVQEQQECEQSAITTTTTVTKAIAPLGIASIQRIHNIGFSKSGDDNRFKYYCLSENCTFLYSNEVIGLESHFICEHSQSTWNGYCQTCKAQVEGIADADMETKLPLSAELKHMRNKHVISAPVPTPAPKPAPTLPTVEELRQPSASSSPAPDDDRPPRIKIRRLTGDCLSTTTPPATTPTPKSITAYDENAQLIELSDTEPTSNKSISTSFLNKLPNTIAEKPRAGENRHFQNIGAQESTFSQTTDTQTAPSASTAKATAPPPCQIQITNVVSLKEQSVVTKTTTPPPTLQLPVISNVCSLNVRSVSSPVNNTGALWAQHIADERDELERSAAESREITRILSDRRHQAQNRERQTTQRDSSESPEPQVVAETLPVQQSTSGNYLITQTVSAQYEEGRLGFNISIANNPSAQQSRSDSGSNASTSSAPVVSAVPQFKCMANGCKYQTRLPLAMGDHLLFHDRQNFNTQREYLRCSQCSYHAEDVDDFLHHTEDKHGMMMRSNSQMETIRDILRNTDSNSSQQASNATSSNAAAGIRHVNKEMAHSFSQETWETVLKDIIAASGVADSKLFRCTIEDCKTKLTESTYYAHVVYHLSTLGQINVNTHTYKCPHCKSTYNKPQQIKAHIKTHGVHKYFCYLCTETTVNIEKMYKHFEERHWRAKKLRSTPLPYKTTDKQNLYYVLYKNSLGRHEIQQFREKLITEWQQKKSNSRTHFKPSEIGLLPLTPIFGRDLNCAVCAYKTKVRTNLMRHLQMHTNDDTNNGTQHVSNVDPINPVPCLISNEKHFDKMTNLASSSLVVGSSSASGGATTSTNGSTNAAGGVNKVPYDYVPDTKRYTCGVSNCQYLTISDDIFRSHLNALHGDILNYNCPHCKEEICKRNLSIERILSHLRFHGPKLYQCEFCGYLHYMKNVVDRHTRQHDVQPPSFVKVIEYDRTKENTAKKSDNSTIVAPTTQSAAKSDTNKSKSKHKWSCNLCGHNTMTQQQIIAHASSQHSCKNQYQCVHCNFTAAQRLQVLTHIDEKHSGKKREVRYVYEQKEDQEDGNEVNAIDTRPLWLRDDPTRVRHIRGILMEDEEESERHSKRLCLDDNDEGDENGDSDENFNLNEFGYLCYYCNTQFANPKDLREKHWQASTCKKFNAEKPFRYRICTKLKCPHCLSFVGNSLVLMEHMKLVHRATKYLAADANATSAGLTCGHCEFRCQTLAQLAQHNARLRHKPFDLKCMSLTQLDTLKTQGSSLTYVQCLTCMELLADQLAFAVHVSLVHDSSVNDIKSQTLQNTLIYACPICQYASQQELPVLRHMIDHYSGFKRCYFCSQPQTTFNGYMQHCYSDHREAIKKFCSIYTFAEISKFLQQMQIVFPNGLTVDLYNLRLTPCQYGNKHIKQLYDEIQKTSQQPPIPRLSLGRLVARKSIEAKLAESGTNSPASHEAASASTAAALQLAGNYVKPTEPAFTPQKIMKRRSTVALGRDDTAFTRFATPSPSSDVSMGISNGKKRKIQQTFGLLPPTSSSPLVNDRLDFVSASDNEVSEQESVISSEPEPYSFYGKTPEPMDLSKIFIKIAAGDTMETRVDISKFKLLYNITPRVVVTPTDMTKYRKAAKANQRKIIKPCPLSHKKRYT